MGHVPRFVQKEFVIFRIISGEGDVVAREPSDGFLALPERGEHEHGMRPIETALYDDSKIARGRTIVGKAGSLQEREIRVGIFATHDAPPPPGSGESTAGISSGVSTSAST